MFMRYFGGGIGHLGQNSSHTHWTPPDNDIDTDDSSVENDYQEREEPMECSDEELDNRDSCDDGAGELDEDLDY
jgi:hypothetical protein